MSSYFNNITQEFQGLGLGGNSERPSSQYSSPPPPNRDYGEYGYHGPNQGAPPPAQYYAAPPLPTYQPPSDKPPLPQGWIPLFDQGRQRWYYANQQDGHTQWEAPGYIPPRPPMETYPSSDSRTYGTPGYGSGATSPYPPAVPYGPTPGSYNGPPGPPPSTGAYAGYDEKGSSDKKKKSGKGGMLLGAGAGIAAGLAGGALLHHALHDDSSSSSDEEEERRHEEDRPPQTVIINNVTNVTEYNDTNVTEYNDRQDSYYGYGSGPPGVLPSRDVEGNYVSESDRESVQEARERYEEALAEAQDSSASSSDYEELAEAREEYYEEYEETYED
ncbi:hypothetical protein PT974_09427 [Cladobotryum mycophilum]|uniref:WW domain-containing protein n=1 Tax=Cladobotryum mycophilum TaxID=491253 RepID=A0ABR0SG41_9HYPO